jgi:hypothetical protein
MWLFYARLGTSHLQIIPRSPTPVRPEPPTRLGDYLTQ